MRSAYQRKLYEKLPSETIRFGNEKNSQTAEKSSVKLRRRVLYRAVLYVDYGSNDETRICVITWTAPGSGKLREIGSPWKSRGGWSFWSIECDILWRWSFKRLAQRRPHPHPAGYSVHCQSLAISRPQPDISACYEWIFPGLRRGLLTSGQNGTERKRERERIRYTLRATDKS